MRPRLIVSLILGTLALPPAGRSAPEIESRYRLFDLSPVSATNPVLARLPDCGIEIPVGEFRGFVAAEGPLAETVRPLTLPEKRALLERLVDEHLLLWRACEQKWDQTEGIVGMINETRNMMLLETLAQKEITAKAKTPEDHKRLASELRDRAFENLKVVVSNETYDALKASVKRLQNKPDAEGPTRDLLDRPLARCDLATIHVGKFLEAYTNRPPDKRPDLEEPAGVIVILKELLGEAALLAAAQERGFQHTREFREGLQLNRNVLTRFYAQDRLTDKVLARLKSPDGQKALRGWYEDHRKDRYTHRDEQGKEQTVSFDAEHESIQNDYFDVLREEVRAAEAEALRKGRKIEIDEKLLDRTLITLQPSAPESPPPPSPARRPAKAD